MRVAMLLDCGSLGPCRRPLNLLCLLSGMCFVSVWTVKLILLLDVEATGLLGFGPALEAEDRTHFCPAEFNNLEDVLTSSVVSLYLTSPTS